MGYSRTDIKIKFDNDKTKFFVNEKKRTVACVVEGVLCTPYDWDKSIMIPDATFTERAVAKCAPEDTFDIERGKRIALARAENRVYMAALRHLDKFMEDVEFFLGAYQMFTEKAYHACAHNEDYIDSLSFEAHPYYKKDLTPMKKGK